MRNGAARRGLNASIAKDAGKQSEATTKLMSNAGEIASFLSTANPYLPKDTVEEIQQLQAKDFAGEAQTWADMTQHMYVIADCGRDRQAVPSEVLSGFSGSGSCASP